MFILGKTKSHRTKNQWKGWSLLGFTLFYQLIASSFANSQIDFLLLESHIEGVSTQWVPSKNGTRLFRVKILESQKGSRVCGLLERNAELQTEGETLEEALLKIVQLLAYSKKVVLDQDEQIAFQSRSITGLSKVGQSSLEQLIEQGIGFISAKNGLIEFSFPSLTDSEGNSFTLSGKSLQEIIEVSFKDQILLERWHKFLAMPEHKGFVFANAVSPPTLLGMNLIQAVLQQQDEKQNDKAVFISKEKYEFWNKKIEDKSWGSKFTPVSFGDDIEGVYVGTRGLRPTMEDQIEVKWFQSEQNPLKEKGVHRFGIFGIFDGHGGPTVARLSKNIVPEVIVRVLSQMTASELVDIHQVRETLEEAFWQEEQEKIQDRAYFTVDQQLFAACKNEGCTSGQGSTAVVGIIINDSVYLINIGDSRAILVAKNGAGIRLTHDHRIDLLETHRISKEGGIIFKKRLFGLLTIPRALGDWECQGLGRKVDITYLHLGLHDPLALVLESDGIHHGLSDQVVAMSVASALKDKKSFNQIAKDILIGALYRQSKDNMALIILHFLPKKEVVSR